LTEPVLPILSSLLSPLLRPSEGRGEGEIERVYQAQTRLSSPPIFWTTLIFPLIIKKNKKKKKRIEEMIRAGGRCQWIDGWRGNIVSLTISPPLSPYLPNDKSDPKSALSKDESAQ
jgi:hypothetical protein